MLEDFPRLRPEYPGAGSAAKTSREDPSPLPYEVVLAASRRRHRSRHGRTSVTPRGIREEREAGQGKGRRGRGGGEGEGSWRWDQVVQIKSVKPRCRRALQTLSWGALKHQKFSPPSLSLLAPPLRILPRILRAFLSLLFDFHPLSLHLFSLPSYPFLPSLSSQPLFSFSILLFYPSSLYLPSLPLLLFCPLPIPSLTNPPPLFSPSFLSSPALPFLYFLLPPLSPALLSTPYPSSPPYLSSPPYPFSLPSPPHPLPSLPLLPFPSHPSLTPLPRLRASLPACRRTFFRLGGSWSNVIPSIAGSCVLWWLLFRPCEIFVG